MKISVLGYVIKKMLSQLIYLSQWHLLAYYLQKKFLGKTQYKTHNGKLLAIDKVFKT